jgi:hypothetical protein
MTFLFPHQFLKVVGGRFSDGVDVVDEPRHAEAVQLLVEELHAQLALKKWFGLTFEKMGWVGL